MKTIKLLLLAYFFVLISSCITESTKPNILLITGGHAFDTTEFFNFFFSQEEYEIDTISQPRANEFLTTEDGKNYDAYVFYDMWKEINEQQKAAYINLTQNGKGFLFLHHSLANYQEWAEAKKIIGGRYHLPAEGKDSALYSNYRHDIELDVNILDDEHSVTLGMADFKILDEGYGNLDLIDQIEPLLTTGHPDCHPVIGWTNQYLNSRVVYLIFGHDKKAYESPEFKELIVNAIDWVQE